MGFMPGCKEILTHRETTHPTMLKGRVGGERSVCWSFLSPPPHYRRCAPDNRSSSGIEVSIFYDFRTVFEWCFCDRGGRFLFGAYLLCPLIIVKAFLTFYGIGGALHFLPICCFSPSWVASRYCGFFRGHYGRAKAFCVVAVWTSCLENPPLAALPASLGCHALDVEAFSPGDSRRQRVQSSGRPAR